MGDNQGSDADNSLSGKISVFIPVYEHSDLLEELLESLANDSYRNREIFVTIDRPSEETLKVVERFRGKINFILSDRRRGKVEALNEAVKLSSGKIWFL